MIYENFSYISLNNIILLMAQSQPKLSRLEPFYGWYKQVGSNYKKPKIIYYEGH